MTFASGAGPAKSLLLIFNPTAGRRRRGLVDAVVRSVRDRGWTVDLVETAAADDARRHAERCDAGRYGVIAVAGGDGTINEVVNGLAARAATAPMLALVPLGTANVLAHELGLGSTAAALAEAITRGRAYIGAGAQCVFVPGIVTAEEAKALVGGIGLRKVSVIGLPGALSASEYEALGVARISYGPMPQNVALTALKHLGESLLADGVIPASTERLNNF